MEVYYTDTGREGHSSFLQFHGCLRSFRLKILFSISGIEMGGGLRLYWFQKCSLSLEFAEEGVEAPLEFIEEGVKDPVEIEEDLENRVESYDALSERQKNNFYPLLISTRSLCFTFVFISSRFHRCLIFSV